MFDGKAFGEEIVSIVRGFMDSEIAPLRARIAELEARPAAKDADPDAVADMVTVRLTKEIERAVAGIPPLPKLPDIPAIIAEAVTEAVAALPPPEKGEKGDQGEPGKDGLSAAGFLIDREGNLIGSMSNGSTRNIGRVVGKDGEPGLPGADGADGKDGLGFDDLDCTFDGERTVTVRFSREGSVREFAFAFPAMIYRDVWKEGETYQRGDVTTWAGSLWHCKAERTKAKPDTSDDWTLAVKRGRDGRDGKVREEKSGPTYLPGKKPKGDAE